MIRQKFLNMVVEHLNENYAHIAFGRSSIWFDAREKIVAIMEDDNIEIIKEVLKEGVLRP